MRDLINVIFLALVQGLTEFLPVSSSGHLVIAQRLLGISEPGITLEVWLHIGTLISILIFYRSVILDLIKGVLKRDHKSLLMAGAIFISTIPAALFYLCCHKWVDGIYESPKVTGGFLIFTGLVLIALRWVRCREGEVTIRRSIVIGLSQALALFPGVSRSGMTIATARATGICPVKAAEFSFLMVIPLLIGAAVMNILRMEPNGEGICGWLLAVGVVISAVIGYLALKALVRLLKDGRFWMFGIYCVAAGLLTVILF